MGGTSTDFRMGMVDSQPRFQYGVPKSQSGSDMSKFGPIISNMSFMPLRRVGQKSRR
jgi:hypothetical protein